MTKDEIRNSIYQKVKAKYDGVYLQKIYHLAIDMIFDRTHVEDSNTVNIYLQNSLSYLTHDLVSIRIALYNFKQYKNQE